MLRNTKKRNSIFSSQNQQGLKVKQQVEPANFATPAARFVVGNRCLDSMTLGMDQPGMTSHFVPETNGPETTGDDFDLSRSRAVGSPNQAPAAIWASLVIRRALGA